VIRYTGRVTDELHDDHFHDECGLFAIWGHPEAANIAYLGLHALQHRGQESCGIVSSDGKVLHAHRAMGLVGDSFDTATLEKLPGAMAIGHVRYATHGSSLLKNAQPIAVEYAGGSLAVAHNGNLVDAETVREALEERGAIFQSTSDTECLVHLVAQARSGDVADRIVAALGAVTGAYSLLFMTEKKIIAVRDPRGFRPLVLGRLGDAHVVASETCAFDLIGAEYVRSVEPGELIEIDARGVRTRWLPGAAGRGREGESVPAAAPREGGRFCVFELVYFARPDSVVEGQPVYEARKRMGQALAREHAVPADLVIAVPDSGVPAAIGYAQESKLPFEVGLVRSHYVGRTFIEPQQSIRHFGVKLKLNAVREVLAGRRVVVVDDSIVRGTTSRKIIKMLRDAGAKEVHFRVSSPPTVGPCFYGIDTPDRGELIAANMSVEEIRKFLACDTLGYLSREGMMTAVRGPGGYCDACFTLNYPVAVQPTRRQHPLRLIAE